MDTVLKAENKLRLMATYWRNSPGQFKVQRELVDDMLVAAAEGKKDEVKKSYAKFANQPELNLIAQIIAEGKDFGGRHHILTSGNSGQ